MDSRTNPLGLIVSLDELYSARGDLYWDEGDSLNPVESGNYSLLSFEYEANTLRASTIVSEISHEFHKNEQIAYELYFETIVVNGFAGFLDRIGTNLILIC